GVALLATAIVTSVCLEWPLWQTIFLIGTVSIIYTTFGGIVADVYSDIIQLAILWAGSLLAIFVLLDLLKPGDLALLSAQQERLRIYDFSATGLGDGKTFGFWPMLIGGFFLYVSYYGCDQSQAQRLLTTATVKQAQKALMINGLFRFLLVSTYCSLGVLLIPFILTHPEFAYRLREQQPDFLVPYFLIENMPKGILGVIIAGFFAASMSSIDSALNSLSAATYQDFLMKLFPRLSGIEDSKKVRLSRFLTIFWGMVATGFALEMAGGSETVLELVNKIGSAFYGPVLAVFLLGMLLKRASQAGAVGGLAAGVGLNISLWLYCGDSVSWLWWNAFGFLMSFAVGYGLGLVFPCRRISAGLIVNLYEFRRELKTKKYILVLLFAFIIMLLTSFILEKLIAG
ncbi:MAG: sodium transporter, partial [Desulfobacteraceae bacterium]